MGLYSTCSRKLKIHRFNNLRRRWGELGECCKFFKSLFKTISVHFPTQFYNITHITIDVFFDSKHAHGGFKINWADFVHVYNLVPRILWILWLRNCTFSTFLLSTLPNLLHLSNLSNPAQRMRGRWIIYSSPSDIFCIPVKKSLLKLHDEPIECLQASKWHEHLFNNNGLVIITKAEIVPL